MNLFYCGMNFMQSEADATYTEINYLISAANTVSFINGLSSPDPWDKLMDVYFVYQ